MKSFKNFLNEDTGFPTGPVGENPNNLAGEVTTSAKSALGDGTTKTNAPSAATHGLPTQNQRFLHLTLLRLNMHY